MTSPIKFGTDGWRGIIAGDFTFDNVRLCAQAAADYLKQSGRDRQGLVIGYDTRFASEDFAAAAAEIIAGNGIKVYLCSQAAPTPVISYGVIDRRAGGGIIITASHNPPAWNGFKYKTEDGASAPTEVVNELEKNISRTITAGVINRKPLEEALKEKLVEYVDLAPAYYRHISELIDLDRLRRAGLKVAVDSMYGAGIGYFRTLLAGGSTEIIEIHAERNPLFPGMHQPEPIEVNLAGLTTTVKRRGASIGIATDGDADRIGIMDENGNFLTQLQVFALLALYLLETRGERGAIIKTETTTSMLYRLGEIFNVPVYETAVGFKYVAPVMMRENALVGGEESGGYGFRGHIPERDGILAGLYFLDFMTRTGKSPSELLAYLYSKVGTHHYHRIDVEFDENNRQVITERVKNHEPQSIEGVKVAKIDTFDGFRFTLDDGSWLLIRFSGTEPLLRIYAESDSIARVNRLLDYGKKLAGV